MSGTANAETITELINDIYKAYKEIYSRMAVMKYSDGRTKVWTTIDEDNEILTIIMGTIEKLKTIINEQ